MPNLARSAENSKTASIYCRDRFRKRGGRRTPRSHYQFKKWTYDKDGNRSDAVVIRPLFKAHADLINTCYYNPATKTQTLYCLVWDLDANRADAKWLDAEGRLDWQKMRETLFVSHPELAGYVVAAIRSTGGKGLALMLGITPMELSLSTINNQKLAFAVQKRLLQLLNYYGMGADPGALGLKRDFANWKDQSRWLDDSEENIKRIQRERRPVLRELNDYLSTISQLTYRPKKGDESYLYPDLRAERGLAKLYTYLLDDYLDGENCSYLKWSQLVELTGLSRPFLRSFLSKDCSWLVTEWCGRVEGWRLTLKPKNNLSMRAYQLKAGIEQIASANTIDLNGSVKPPSAVEDGERNHCLTKAVLKLKHAGIEESEALRSMQSYARQIPGHEMSRNCRSVSSIVKSIYFNKPHYFGCKVVELMVSGYAQRGIVSETIFIREGASPLPARRESDSSVYKIAVGPVDSVETGDKKTKALVSQSIRSFADHVEKQSGRANYERQETNPEKVKTSYDQILRSFESSSASQEKTTREQLRARIQREIIKLPRELAGKVLSDVLQWGESDWCQAEESPKAYILKRARKIAEQQGEIL